ncbi:MAG: hypothetical protein U1B30_16475 [Pseudomonadota bacterium]|nr:hypothetical protein [Pseudomonadota bacterium]
MARFYGSLIVLLLFGNGCAAMFLANTEATYEVPNGPKITWKSDKEHEGLKFSMKESKDGTKEVKVEVMRSGTPEAATAAALEAQIKMIDLLGSQMKGGKVP